MTGWHYLATVVDMCIECLYNAFYMCSPKRMFKCFAKGRGHLHQSDVFPPLGQAFAFLVYCESVRWRRERDLSN